MWDQKYSEQNDNKHIMKKITQLLIYIHKGEKQKIYKLCAPTILWKYNYDYCTNGNSIEKINEICEMAMLKTVNRFTGIEYQIKDLGDNNILVTGNYKVTSKDDNKYKIYNGDYTIILSNDKASFIQLEIKVAPKKIHRVKTISQAIYYMSENDILYLETINGHLQWHYRDEVIESLDTLSSIEEKLSEDFVRIHRSYIVNKKQVENIQRCNKRCILTMVNGDIIPIPYKKYVKCRKRLLY